MKALMLNPVSYKTLVKRYGVKEGAKRWRKLQKQAKSKAKSRVSNKKVSGTVSKGGLKVAKKGGTVKETTLLGKKIRFKTPMPRSWVQAWKAGYEEWVKSGHPIRKMKERMPAGWIEAYQEGLREAFGQPLSEFSKEWIQAWKEGVLEAARRVGQPVNMPEWWWERWAHGLEKKAAEVLKQAIEDMPLSWRRKWAEGMLEKAAPKVKRVLSPAAYSRWESRIRSIARSRGRRTGQPLDIAGTLRTVASVSTLEHVLAGTAGIVSTTLGPMAIEKIIKRPLGTYGRLGVSAGSAVTGFVALSATGRPALARTFLASALGGMLASYLIERFGGGVSGLGQVEEEEIRKAVEEEVAKTLAEEGISGSVGQLTAEELEELGEVGEVGQLTAEEMEELAGVPLE